MDKPALTASTQNLPDEVLRALRRILRRISEHSRSLARVQGLSMPQLLCLRSVAEAEPGAEVTVAMVAESVQLSAATVSRILDRLEEGKLIKRERKSRDRRRVCLTLTAAGRRKVQRLPIPLQEEFVNRLQLLSAAEQTQILVTLQKIVDMMEAGELDAAPILDPAVEIKSTHD